MEHVRVAIVGAGPAGLALSRELGGAGVEHVVLERGRVGETWRGRWDSFCLVTPNWTVQLPDGCYDGDDPDGFMPRDEIVSYLEGYAAGHGVPIRERVDVRSLECREGGGFNLATMAGEIRADAVVLATGAYQRPYRPDSARSLPGDLLCLDVDRYRNERELPPGAVLVVGSGQSGCQIAEELHEAGREVVLACGRAPWVPRRLGDRDVLWWACETGFVDTTVESLPSPSARVVANILSSGRNGGHDLHLRTLRELGVTLVGHFLGVTDHEARFAPDLAETVAWGDERFGEFMDLVRNLVAGRGLELPRIEEPPPFDPRAPERIDLRPFGAVIFAGGFRPDYRSWLPWPDAFDALGFPIHRNGASPIVPGLYFIGVHFLRKRKSATLYGVAEDGAVVADSISASFGSG